mmetsp:Transcript_83770/g.184068  ORF Transcript_83770/g.184068 Transcript_83770/m.184068 type:complete len:523 (-) Transcript_83770:157-1725(-)
MAQPPSSSTGPATTTSAGAGVGPLLPTHSASAAPEAGAPGQLGGADVGVPLLSHPPAPPVDTMSGTPSRARGAFETPALASTITSPLKPSQQSATSPWLENHRVVLDAPRPHTTPMPSPLVQSLPQTPAIMQPLVIADHHGNFASEPISRPPAFLMQNRGSPPPHNWSPTLSRSDFDPLAREAASGPGGSGGGGGGRFGLTLSPPNRSGSSPGHQGDATSMAQSAPLRSLGQDSSLLADELWRDARWTRMQLDAKRTDLASAQEALEQTEKRLREVMQDRHAKFAEIKALRAEAAEFQARDKERRLALRQAESLLLEWEDKQAKSKEHMREVEQLARRLEADLQEAERARDKALDRAQWTEEAALREVREAQEAQHRFQAAAAKQIEDVRREFAEIDRLRQDELSAAMEELRRMEEAQTALRTDLRKGLRPVLEAQRTEDVNGMRKLQKDDVWEAAFEIARGRSSRAFGGGRNIDPLKIRDIEGFGRNAHWSGTLLEGRVREQADRILATVATLGPRRPTGL